MDYQVTVTFVWIE